LHGYGYRFVATLEERMVDAPNDAVRAESPPKPLWRQSPRTP
jgi:hypothetical protein